MSLKEKINKKITNKLTSLLDNYYTEMAERKIRDELISKFALSFKFVEYPNRICLEMKPYKYKDYTYIADWNKNESFLMLLNIDKNIEFIKNKINKIDKNNEWE